MHLLSVSSKQGRGYIKDRSQQDRLQQAVVATANRQLQQCLQAGIAFHNAGMEAEERAMVEQLFMQRAVLVSSCAVFVHSTVCNRLTTSAELVLPCFTRVNGMSNLVAMTQQH